MSVPQQKERKKIMILGKNFKWRRKKIYFFYKKKNIKNIYTENEEKKWYIYIQIIDYIKKIRKNSVKFST